MGMPSVAEASIVRAGARPLDLADLEARADKAVAMFEPQASKFRIEKTRAKAELMLATGATVRGWFFLWPSSQSHHGPDRIGDLLNEQTGFFPFGLEDGHTALYNRAHIVQVRLPDDTAETQMEPGYEVATRHVVSMLLSTGHRITGTVSVFLPEGHDRLSDYARGERIFRYVETKEHTLIVNSVHMVELKEIKS